MLDVWPPLPIEIYLLQPYDVDSIITILILEHRDRIRKIRIFNLTSPQLERLAPLMHEPFPALTFLQLWGGKAGPELPDTVPELPDMFLGGSAPGLQLLALNGITFPGLPTFLLSATDLSSLSLYCISRAGYISPEAIATGLSPLTRLTNLLIQFEFAASRLDLRDTPPPPLICVILPALINITFQGDNEYLEDFIARIDTPLLNYLNISFFDRVVFDIPQLLQFLTHTGMTKSYNRTGVVFGGDCVEFSHRPLEGTNTPGSLILGILLRGIDQQVSCITKICSQYSFLLPGVEQLDIYHRSICWQVDSDETLWLEFFRPFTAVRTLRISCHPQSSIMRALQELTTIEVLPALDGLYLEDYQPSGPGQKAIEPLIVARQYSDHPVAVYRWERSD